MSPLPSGSEFHDHSYTFPITGLDQVGEARRFALALAAAQGFDETNLGRVGIVVNELGTNLAKYAVEGELLVRKLDEPAGIDILSIDRGPGFSDAARVLVDGYSSGSSPGTGLGAVARQADVFDIHSLINKGTVIAAIFYRDGKPEDSSYETGAVSVPLVPETVCGDGWRVKIDRDAFAVCMIDGLGHGLAAHEAAAAGCAVFAEHPFESPEITMSKIHGRLKTTRGGAVFIAVNTDGHDIRFTGLGNIRAFVLDGIRMKAMVSQNGTAGVQMRQHRVLDQPWTPPFMAIFHSDGLHTRWDLNAFPGLATRHPAVIAGVAYRDFARGKDDATILVIAGAR